jgi:CD109 antigen
MGFSDFAAINYLKAISKPTKEREEKFQGYLSSAYQRVLKLQKPDGSFSFMGETDDESVWLTGYIVKHLRQAEKFIKIDHKIIDKATAFIKSKQKLDGSFSGPLPITAFIAIAFMESEKVGPEDKAFVDNCLSYIDANAINMKDNLALAITAYAFALNKHPKVNEFLKTLLDNAIIEDGEMFWYREASENPATSVETAAYAIMAMSTANRAVEAYPIVNWLVEQRNSKGGFFSTTSTVLATEALAMIILKFYAPNNVDMQIELESGRGRQNTFKINSANALIMQRKKLEPDTNSLQMSANGTGLGLFQISYKFDTSLLSPQNRFELTAELLPSSNNNLMHLKICASFIPHEENIQSSLTFIEIHLPSGYVYDPDVAKKVHSAVVRVRKRKLRSETNSIERGNYSQKTETQKQKTLIVLYFESMNETQVCPEIIAVRQNIVTDLKRSVVKVYDYFNKSEEKVQPKIS